MDTADEPAQPGSSISDQPKAIRRDASTPVAPTVPCVAATAGVSDADAQKAVEADYAKLDEFAKSQTVYLTLNHLTEGKCESEMDYRRYGLGVLMNMLSRAKDIVPTQFIDENKHIAKFNVSDLTWTPESIGYVLTIAKRLDYGVQSGLSGGPVILKGDWATQQLTRPPVYMYVVRSEILERLIEAQAGATEDITKPRTFGGVYESGVALYPRLLERRESSYGVCWISHDFLYRPQAMAVMETGLLPQDDLRFGLQIYIAREYICSLPNGLHEYNVTGFVSQRRYDAGGCVAKNLSRPDQLVLTGQCFNCHTNGWIPFKDKVRGGNANPSQYMLDHYPLQDDLDAMFAHDQALFEDASKKIPFYSAQYVGSPLNELVSEYSARSGDPMVETEGGTFGAILPRSASLGPVWEQYINPIASLAVDVGILLPVSIANQAIPEYLSNSLEQKYAEHGISEDLSKGCFNKVPPAADASVSAPVVDAGAAPADNGSAPIL